MQSTKYNDDFGICCCVCSFCLSINRRTTSVLQLSERLLNLTAFSANSQSTQVCWECKARLKNYSEFCERSGRSQEVLNQVNTQASLKGKSLSRLVISNTLVISTESQIPDKNYNSDSDDNHLVHTETLKKERDELDEKNEILVDFATGIEYTDNYSESEYSNNCDDAMVASNLRSEKYDEFVCKNADKLESKDDPICLNETAEDTPNGSNSKDIDLCANKSSNANYSRNFYIDYELYEKFITPDDEMREYLKPTCFKNKCKVCLVEFRTIDNLLKHMKIFHSDCVGEHKCDVCGFGQPTEIALKLHRQQHYQMYRCLADGCRFVHKFPPSLDAHQITHKSTGNNVETYACHHCKKKFKNIYNVLKHIRHVHLDATKCKHCSKDFKDRKSLYQHMKLLHVDKMVVCDICGVMYATSSELQNHLLKHRNLSQKRFACKICNKSFSCRFKEIIHQFVHNDKPRVRCHLCKTEFIEVEARTRHLKSRHGVTKEDVSKKPPSAKRCRKKKDRLTDVTMCKLCGKDFKFPSILENHVVTQHSEARPFKCHICSDGFKTRPILDNHVRKHSDDRPFKCDACNKSFKFQSNLYTHKILHRGEKPFMCDICSTSFAYKGTLKDHMRIHTGEKKFHCNVCGKKFPTNSSLKKHTRVH